MVTTSDRVRARQAELVRFCQRHHIKKLAFFGSVLRDDFDEGSDIDVLVEFEAGKTPGLGFFRIQDDLSKLLGREVDLLTPDGLSKYFRADVLSTAEVLYEA